MNRPLLFNLGIEEDLFHSVAAGLDGEIGDVDVRRFPDGETYIRFNVECAQRPTILACSLDRPDPKTLPLLFAADTLRDLGAANIGLVAPYLAYMRQDKRFHAGEGITSRYYAALLSRTFDWLVTVDPHLHRFHEMGQIYSIPARVAHAAPGVAHWIRDHVASPVLIGPDSESRQWVDDVAGRAGAPFVVLSKQRRGDRTVEISIPDIERYSDATPVLVDDIISTGQTMAATIHHLNQLGTAPPVCVGVHAIFAEGAEQALAPAATIATCNTVSHPSNQIDVTEPILEAIQTLNYGVRVKGQSKGPE
ncbi:ribose-phosphate pyrophosphokinase [Elongatibacter sediminis]|uniref:Ribose-phosphate pyrophosphokinase n=1 Tax=Elongatibacter sediminis TaxID=3119006 RepID=A0AAW9RC45_9GAMM